MKHAPGDIQALAQRAAEGAGFPRAQSEMFGRAAVFHLADGGAPDALIAALENPGNSPILRLPLVLGDLVAACKALGGSAELTLLPSDAPLALSYTRLLPVALSGAEVVASDKQHRLRISTDGTEKSVRALPDPGVLPSDLMETFKRLSEKRLQPERS